MDLDWYLCHVCGAKFCDEKELGVCLACGSAFLLLIEARKEPPTKEEKNED